MPNAVFSPTFLAPEESLIYQRYIRPVLSLGYPFIHFNPDVPWQKETLKNLKQLFTENEKDSPDELLSLRLLLSVWQNMVDHIDFSASQNEKPRADYDRKRLQDMMQYIQDHFDEPISLANIAEAAYISKSSALQIFQRGIHTTPVAYLNQYRLKQAAALLRAGNFSVTEIAERTGFSSTGYFCRQFKNGYSASPLTYRKAQKKTE